MTIIIVSIQNKNIGKDHPQSDLKQMHGLMKSKNLARMFTDPDNKSSKNIDYTGHYEKNTNRHENHKHTKSYKNKINDYIEERKIKLIDEFFKLEAKSKGLTKHLGSKLEPIRSSKGKQRVKWKDGHRGSTSKPTTNLERNYSENILSRGKDIKNFHSNINVKLSNFDQRRKSDGIVPNTKEELKYHKGEESSHNRKRRDLNRDNNINMRDYQSHQITLSGNGNYEKIYIDPTKAK